MLVERSTQRSGWRWSGSCPSRAAPRVQSSCRGRPSRSLGADWHRRPGSNVPAPAELPRPGADPQPAPPQPDLVEQPTGRPRPRPHCAAGFGRRCPEGSRYKACRANLARISKTWLETDQPSPATAASTCLSNSSSRWGASSSSPRSPSGKAAPNSSSLTSSAGFHANSPSLRRSRYPNRGLPRRNSTGTNSNGARWIPPSPTLATPPLRSMHATYAALSRRNPAPSGAVQLARLLAWQTTMRGRSATMRAAGSLPGP